MPGLSYQNVSGSEVNSAFPSGYIDAHVHLLHANGLQDAAAAGITGVRDAGSRQGIGLSCSSQASPRCLSAGWALFKRGGYGAAFGVAVETRDDIKREILKLKKAGAGIIKVMASGMVSLKEKGTITPGGFDRNELADIVHEARLQGLGVMAHANGEGAIIAASEAGVRSIEHGFFMTPGALAAMAQAGVFWTPTVGALNRASRVKALSTERQAYVSELIASHLEMVRRAYETGVLLAIGTDCVLPDPRYGQAYEEELRYFEQAGLSRESVLAIAGNGALLLEKE